jgi:thiol-disulfide isomerase/thioredoxin
MRLTLATLVLVAPCVLALGARRATADDVGPAAPGAAAPSAARDGIAFEPGTPSFADALAKAKAAGKPLFVDFTTDWCGWCRKLEKEVFSQASVGKLMQALVCVQIDAEKRDGPSAAKRYGVSGFPTLVVIDGSGEEIDRIVGYRPPPVFTQEIKRILRDEGTLRALRKRWAEAPDDLDAGLALAGKFAATDGARATDLLSQVAEKAKTRDREMQARVLLEQAAVFQGAGRTTAAADAAETLVRDFADTKSAPKAAMRAGAAFLGLDSRRALAFLDAVRRIAKEPADRSAVEAVAVEVHRSELAAALKRQAEAVGDEPGALNDIAWKCFEMKLNLPEAIGWARRAVEKSERDPLILDTLANLLWITGARQEALGLEKEALGKVDAGMKKEFAAVIARWTAEMEANPAAVPLLPAAPTAPTAPAGK